MGTSRKTYNEAGEVKCSSCGQFYPNTAEHFVTDKKCHDGLSARCKACHNIHANEIYSKPSKHLYPSNEGRVCLGCGVWKSWDNYKWRSKKKPSRGREARCNECRKMEKNAWYAENKNIPGFREHCNKLHNDYRQRLRNETFAAYGNQCACCGESHVEFLGIDHINGGGTQHRKQIKCYGVNFYDWLRQRGYPKEYQILCHNCNLAKGFFGYCPHERERSDGS